MRRTIDVKVRHEDLEIEVIEFDEVSTFAYRPTNCTQKRTLWASKRALSVRVCVQSHQLYAEKDAFDLGMGPKRPNVRTVPPSVRILGHFAYRCFGYDHDRGI